MTALRILQAAIGPVVAYGFPEAGIAERLDKLDEEVAELRAAVVGNGGDARDELADVVIVCANIAAFYHIDLESAVAHKLPRAITQILENVHREP